MPVDNFFQTQLNVNPSIEVESNVVVFDSPTTVIHFNASTKLFINNIQVSLGTHNLVANDYIKLAITSQAQYAKHAFGLVKINSTGVTRTHSFAVVTRHDIEPRHIPEFVDKIPFEMNETLEGYKVSDYVFQAKKVNHKIVSFDKNLSIQYPDEQFRLDYELPVSQFNSDVSFVTCSYYTDKVLRHSKKTKKLIASIPVSGHPSEFAEVPNIPGTDNITNLWVTLSDKNKVAIISNGNVVTQELSTGDFPTGIIYNGTSVFVANSHGNTVSRYDWNGSNWTELTLPVSAKPHQLTTDSNNDVWVSCAGSVSVCKIVGNSVFTYTVGSNPRGLVCANGNIWVTLSKTDQLVKLDLNGNILATIDEVGVHPYAISRPIEIDDGGVSAYVQDDYFSSNAVLINADDSFFGGHNGEVLDSSGSEISVLGNPQHVAFSPYQEAWSCEFNGAPITVPSNPLLLIGTSDFTIEFWINFKEVNSQGIFHTSTNNLSGSLWCGYKYDGLMVAISGSEGTHSFGFWFTPKINRWTHVAIARGAGATRIFINGELRASTTKLNGIDIKQNSWLIGNNSDVSIPFTGFISDFHVTKTCKYVGSSDINNTEIVTDAFTILSTLGGRNFSDKSANNLEISPSFGSKISHFSPYSTGFSYYDNYSGLFNGTSDYVVSAVENNLGKNDFTFETWLYRNSLGSGKLIELGNLVIREDGTIDNVVGAIIGAKSIKSGAWAHLAIVKRDGTYYRYIDGVLVDSVLNDNHITGRTLYSLRMYSGYVMNFRFTTSAVYTSNFSVPNKVLVLPETQLLLKFKNAAIVDFTGKNVVATEAYPFTHSNAKFGEYALSFDTKTIRVPHKSHFTLWDRDLTIEFWVNTTDPNCVLMSKSNSSFTNNSWRIKLVGGLVTFDHSGLSNGYLIGTSNVADGQWHLITLTKYSRTERLFVDGIREDVETVCLSNFINFPNSVHEQTNTPLTIHGNMESGDVYDLTANSVITIISGSQYVTLNPDNSITTADIVPNAAFTIQAVTTYKGEVFTVTKNVTITHNPELVSIEITGPGSIIERDNEQYSIIAHLSDGTSYIPANSQVTWELYSAYASVDSSGLVTANNITDSSKIVTLHATYTDPGVEPVTKSASTFISIVYYPELVSTQIYNQPGDLLVEGATLQLYVNGTLENGAVIPLSSNVWDITAGGSYGSITPNGILTLNTSTAGQSITVRAVSEYLAGIITNTVTSYFTFTVAADFTAVELLLSGDVLSTTETVELVSVVIVGPSLLSEDEFYKYEAFGTFDDGSVRNVSAFTDWSITVGGAYATIYASGLLVPNDVLVDRNVTIHASTTKQGINKTADKNIVIDYVPKLESVVINSTSFNELSSGQLLATAFWDDGTSFDPSTYTTWELVSGTAASVASNGIITTNEVSSGDDSVVVKAITTRGGITKEATKTITIINLPKLVSLTLIKASGVTSSGTTHQFTSTGVLEDSTSINASPYTTWSIQSGVGSINSSGLLTIPLNSIGEVIVVRGDATYQNGTAFNTYTVTVIDDFSNVELLLSGDILATTIIPQLTAVTVNGASIVTEQTTSQYTATGHFNNGGADIDISYKTTWSIVSGASFGSINSSTGLFTAGNITGGDKSVTIRATSTYRGITVTSDKTITVDIVPVFSGIIINGANSVIEQTTSQYTVTGQMDDGSTFDASSYTTWSIFSGITYASINSSGLLTANDVTASDRTVVVRASTTYNSTTFVQDKTVTITWVPIFESAIISGGNSIYEYGYTQLSITGYYDGGTSFDAAPYTTWAIISGGSLASVNSSGLVTGSSNGGTGTVIVEATTTHAGNTINSQYSITILSAQLVTDLLISGDILGTTQYPVLTSGTINGSSSVVEGNTQQYTLTGHFNNGGADLDLSSKTTWSIVSGGANGSINSSSGLFTAASISPPNKTVTIRATTTHRYTTITTDLVVTVTYIQTFTSVTINGANSVNENSTSQYTATGNMDDGATFDAQPYTTWSIFSGAAFASIDSSGLLTTNNVTANQSVTIRATTTYNSTTIIQDKIVTVVWVPIFDHVEVTGVTTLVTPGTTDLNVLGYLDDGSTFDAQPYTTWSIISGNAYATVDSNGLVTTILAPSGTIVTVEASTTYLSTTRTDTHSITLQPNDSDPYFSSVSLLLNGENVTPYTEFSIGVSLLLNGENPLETTVRMPNVSLLMSGELTTPHTPFSFVSVLISGELQ